MMKRFFVIVMVLCILISSAATVCAEFPQQASDTAVHNIAKNATAAEAVGLTPSSGQVTMMVIRGPAGVP